MTESFGRDVNRFHKVPAINDNGFKLSESVAIFHYLGRMQIIPERWYPSKNFKALVRIGEYLEWQQNNLVIVAGQMFKKLWLEPLVTGKEPKTDQAEFYKKSLNRTLDDLETIWLKDSKFITGGEITFADLMAVSMLEQVMGLNLFKVDKTKHPKVAEWSDEVRQYFGDAFQQAHKFLYKFAKK